MAIPWSSATAQHQRDSIQLPRAGQESRLNHERPGPVCRLVGLLRGCHETPDGPYDPGLRRPGVQKFRGRPTATKLKSDSSSSAASRHGLSSSMVAWVAHNRPTRPWPVKASGIITFRLAAPPTEVPAIPPERERSSSRVFIPTARNVPLPGSRRPAALCDHEGVPKGTASRGTTRYMVRLTVPCCGGWRAWGIVRADFERALADPADPAIAAAEIASEHRRGANYVRVTVTLAVAAADVADALTIAWDAFTATADDLTGWEGTAASAEVQPGLPLTGADVRSARIGLTVASARSPVACRVHPRLAPGPLGSPAVQAAREWGHPCGPPSHAPLVVDPPGDRLLVGPGRLGRCGCPACGCGAQFQRLDQPGPEGDEGDGRDLTGSLVVARVMVTVLARRAVAIPAALQPAGGDPAGWGTRWLGMWLARDKAGSAGGTSLGGRRKGP